MYRVIREDRIADSLNTLLPVSVNADALVKGTNENGVYDCQSDNNDTLDHLSFREAVSRGINSIDMMAMTYCEENGIPGLLLCCPCLILIYCQRLMPPYFLFPESFYVLFLSSFGL